MRRHMLGHHHPNMDSRTSNTLNQGTNKMHHLPLPLIRMATVSTDLHLLMAITSTREFIFPYASLM